jgi:diaminopimelate epimerase
MRIDFSKYQGTGNDFVMLNNLDGKYNSIDESAVKFICDRRFGVGADGLIRLNSIEDFDFEVDYFNADGSKSFCGNGARCSVAFAESLGIDVSETTFFAIDGKHKAWKKSELVALEIRDVLSLDVIGENVVLNTGSPHYIHFEDGKQKNEIVSFGKSVRYSDTYLKDGINVNLVSILASNLIEVQTYERGVENETLSCGTGVTASALATAFKEKCHGQCAYDVQVKGGQLKVEFNRTGEFQFEGIRLTGPAEFVFNGTIHV